MEVVEYDDEKMEIEEDEDIKSSTSYYSVSNPDYFTFKECKKIIHPCNPNTNGLISSRILPDESNLIKFGTSMNVEFNLIDNHNDFSKKGDLFIQKGNLNLAIE